MSHHIEIVPGVEGVDGIRINGTLYPAAEVVAALRERPHAEAVTQAARAAVAVADACRAIRGQLAPLEAHPVIRRLIAQADDAEAQAWAMLADAVDEGAQGPRVPRR